MAGNLVVSTINGVAIGVINAIINGNFGVNQRGVSGTVTLTAGAYGHDRWKAGASGCTYTFATVDNVTTLTISAGSLIQVIEGLNLQSGTYTLSWTGTAQGKIGAGSYAASGVQGTAVGGTNLNIEFGTGTVSLVQFEKGSTATPFEFRSIGNELGLCQRYFCKSYSQNTVPGAATGIGEMSIYTGTSTTNPMNLTVRFPVEMRSPPSVVAYDELGASGKVFKGAQGQTASIGNISTGAARIGSSSSTAALELAYQYTASAEL
jgi:hypothetical protein